MELMMGRSFRLRVLEHCIRSMSVGQVAAFSDIALALTATEYPLFSQQFRAFAVGKSAGGGPAPAAGAPPMRRCCGGGGGGSQSTGHADLDRLARHPEPIEITIELLSLEQDYEQEVWQMEEADQWAALPLLKRQARQLFEGGDVAAAGAKYAKALALVQQLQLRLHPSDADYALLQSAHKPLLLSNYAQCLLFAGEHYAAVRVCTQVLDIDPNHVKSLWRRGRARVAVGDWDAAAADLKAAAALDPGLGPAVQRILIQSQVDRRQRQEQERRALAGRLFPS